MISAEDPHLIEALDWVRRIHDPDFTDWEAHAAWLDADPDNAEAFDNAAMLIEDAASGLAPAPMPVEPVAHVNDNDDARSAAPRRWAAWSAGIGAAAALVVFGIAHAPRPGSVDAQPYQIATGPGASREIALSNGTRITLNGNSSVRLDHGDPRLARLEKGEAFFAVTHDPVHPFTVHAGDAIFQDVGTSFDVTRDGNATHIAVLEGAVLYDPNGAAIRLGGGRSMHILAGDATVQPVDPASVGGWRTGRLTYRNAPITTVAADVARSIGQPVVVDGSASQRTFSGVIIVDPDRPRMFRRIAAVAGLTIRHDASGWRMLSPTP